MPLAAPPPQKAKEECSMAKKMELEYLYLLHREYWKLEKMKPQMEKCRDAEKKNAYKADYDECKSERDRLLGKELLNEIPFSSKEKIMAELHYYHGKSWSVAYDNMVDEIKSSSKQDEYHKNKKAYKARLEKSIMRKIQPFYNYYSKKK